MLKTYKILLSGQVQGVGFRPFVFKLAKKHTIKGTVSNDENGVIIFASQTKELVDLFYKELLKTPPPVSNIISSKIIEIEPINFEVFKIIPSTKKGQVNLPLTPDFAICDDCKNDIQDSKNRRFNYPFTTCVNCGPRWAITQSFPFERNHTSINEYKMCSDCEDEYKNSSNRRFHSQTNTCNFCGIELYLETSNSQKIPLKPEEIFKKVALFLKQGKIIAIKNTSGYLLCCNAEDDEVIKKLRKLKNRPKKPFAILYPSLEKLQNELEINKEQRNSLTSTQRPITIISLQNCKGNIALKEVAPDLNQLGVMLPYTGILQLLANELSFPIVATSGNIHGSPILSSRKKAKEELSQIADYFLHHNLKITQPQDDSVLKFSFKFQKPILFRRSRGYAPNYFNAAIKSSKKAMAFGADLKSSITFYPNQYVYISQYLGNLENFDVYNRFSEMVNSFIKIFEQNPQVVLVDKHPLYHSTTFGKEFSKKNNVRLVEIQHHKAHFAAVLGEHNLFDKKVLGVVFDGTGYGDDNAIWGGEFFNYEANEINRISHFEYFNWLLGDKMSKEPRISLLSLATSDIDEILASKFTLKELKTYKTLKQLNNLKTSSVGRLFDAVASILNITDYNSYEGEAAILLENLVADYNLKYCKSYIHNFEREISSKEIINNIAIDIEKGINKQKIIVNFIFTLADLIIKIAKTNNYKHVAFSGGVFQNSTLVDMILELASEEIKLYFHTNLAPNDENISFGQLMYYLHIKN
ncbi:MAG: carbamoyltransferase HypF [Lutibacter sp.]|uniref:carbamoyltransferase HypF n=1 Tax=Lutibacter sp. TaxID=1925666 RepID=UPI00299E3AC1|nr:carbamoyltransferase HypF [Lutibacter sp.]MDX1828552.1 carbamoyltransferase HypF [Lutibacter sp.]